MTHKQFVRRHKLTPFGAWLVRRHWFTVGMIYALLLPGYAVIGVLWGWARGILEAGLGWQEHREKAMARSVEYREKVWP